MTFKRQDFVEVEDFDQPADQPPAPVTEIVRVEGIFLHHFDNARRIFVSVTKATMSDRYDPILGSGYRRGSLRRQTEPHILGLPAIYARYPYVVMVEPDGAEDQLKLGGDNATEFIWAERTLVWL
jgi:hypothetical protein